MTIDAFTKFCASEIGYYGVRYPIPDKVFTLPIAIGECERATYKVHSDSKLVPYQIPNDIASKMGLPSHIIWIARE